MFLSILSGIFIGTSYIPFFPWALLICMIPLWFIWLFQPLSYYKVFFYGWLTQFTFCLIGFHWIYHTAVEFGRLHPIVAILILILFCTTQNLHIPLTGLLWKYTQNKLAFSQKNSILFLAISTALLERIYPMLFYWNLGYPWFWMKWPAYQWADTIGFEGLSFLTFLINAQLLWVLIHIKKCFEKSSKKSQRKLLQNNKIIFGHLVSLIILLTFLHVTGKNKQKFWAITDQVLHVGAVQANIGNFDKYMSYHGLYQSKVYQQYFDLTEDLIESLSLKNQKLDIVVWPETAFPGALDRDIFSIHKIRLRNYIAKQQLPLITGAYSREQQSSKPYNALFLFDQTGQLLEKYRKTILLAFGEYFPGAGILPVLKEWFPQVSHFSAGSGPQTWQWNDITIGTQICYEGLYPYFSTSLAQQGADVIVNVTNDSWFGHTFQPYQHLYMTLARAIEVRRPLIRVTNTGITSAILADGTILQQSSQQKPWIGHFTIAYSHQAQATVFAQFGKYIPLLQIVLLILITLKRDFITRCIGMVVSRRMWWRNSWCSRR